MTKWVRHLIGVLMAFALLSALWSTALARVSDHQTAVTLLTDTGTELINPVLVANGSGLAQGGYQQLEQSAAAHPNQQVQIGFIKAPLLGSEIAGKNFTDGTRVIYSHMAEVFYANGPQAAFNLPPQLQSFINSYSPFVASKNAAASALPKLPIPTIPSFVAPFFTHIGISPTTLTADGHNAYQIEMVVFWIATLVLAAILALTARGWDRLRRVMWPVFHASWFLSLVGIIGTVLVSLHPTQSAPYRDILDIIGSAFFTVFYIATAVGIAGIAVSYAAPHFIPAGTGAVGDTISPRAARPPSDKPQPYTPLRSDSTLSNDNRGTADRAPYRYADSPSSSPVARPNSGGRGAAGYQSGSAPQSAAPGGERWANPRQDFPPSQARWPSLGQDHPQQDNPAPQDLWNVPQQGYPAGPAPQDPWSMPPPAQDAWSHPPQGYPPAQAPWNMPQPGTPPAQDPRSAPAQGYPFGADRRSGPVQGYPPASEGQPEQRPRYRQAPDRRPDAPPEDPPAQDSWINSR